MIAFSSYRSWSGIRRTGCTSFDMVFYDARAPNRLACPGKNLVKGRKRLFEIFAFISGDVIRQVDGVVGGLQSRPSMSKVVSSATSLRSRVSGLNEMLQSCARRKSHPIMIFHFASGETRKVWVHSIPPTCTTPSTAPVMSSVKLLATVNLTIGKGNGLVSVQCLVTSLWISETVAPESMGMDECLPPRMSCSTNGLNLLTCGRTQANTCRGLPWLLRPQWRAFLPNF